MDYRELALKLRTENFVSELKTALTHKSFYAQANETKGNSRYVFAGMFAFKGAVADVLFRYVPGAGTQLQHALGNMFKNECLEKIFTSFRLEKLIRYGGDFKADSHRHIFVYGLLGYLYVHANEEARLAFIRRHFILPSKHLFVNTEQRNDLAAQCDMLANMLFGHRPKLEVNRNAAGQWTSTLSVNETVLASETSSSHRYSRHKTLKNALIHLLERLQKADEQQAGYADLKQRMEGIALQKTAAQKAEKQAAYKKKQEEKAEIREKKKQQRELQARLQDKKRREAKAAAKLRKQRQQEMAAQRAAAMANMSADKRRRLQDKGWL